MPSLFDPGLKVQWAKRHLDVLTQYVNTYQAENHYTLTTEEDSANGWFIITTKVPHNEMVFTIALIMGDFVNCLRSSLDHLAWQLAMSGGRTPTRDTCFPICERDTIDAQVKIAKSTFGFPDEAVSVVKSLQPYKDREEFKKTHLWRLNLLWNMDKHRHIMPHSVVTGWQFKLESLPSAMFPDGKIPMPSEQLPDGVRMKFPLSLRDYIVINPEPTSLEVKFGSMEDGIEMGLNDLLEMYEFVESVMVTFTPFFAEQYPHELNAQES